MMYKQWRGERGTMGAGPLFAIVAILFGAFFYRWMAQPHRYGAFEHWPLIAKLVGIGVPGLFLLLAFGSSTGRGFVTYDPPPQEKGRDNSKDAEDHTDA